jgi:hypothetical protein
MKIKFNHPLWIHIPAVVAFLAGLAFTLKALPLPDPAPLHFTFSGEPDRYGSPWMSTIMLAGLSILYILLSFFLDETWARQEKRKIFNWLSLFDDVTIAMLAAVQITYLNMLASANYVYPFPWLPTVLAGVLAAGAAIVLEKIRPFRPYHSSLEIEDVGLVKTEITKVIKSGQKLAYWEVQNPAYSRALSIGVPLIMVVVAVTAWSEVPWLSVLFALIGIALVLIYGGFRTLVTREGIAVRMGMLNLSLLKLKTGEIASAELQNFQPLQDFGGYGIRFNKDTKAYFLRGNRGVKITTREGKKYLIGSDHAERLAAVISSLIG